MHSHVEIQADEVLDVVTGKKTLVGNAVEVHCEGVTVCMVQDGKVTHMACDHTSHGVHPRFKAVTDKMVALLGECKAKLGVDLLAEVQGCPKCDGSGWVPMSSAAADTILTAAKMLGFYRGIRVGDGSSLNPEKLRDTLESFLSSGIVASREMASMRPVGKSGRAQLFKDQNKDQNGGESNGTG